MKTRFFQAEMKEIEIKNWSIKIKWFASTPDIDRYNDIVNPKAFKEAIEGYMNNPVILLQHNSDKPIWKTIDYKVWSKGLNVTVELTNDIDNVFKNIQDWILKWFSIWFIPKKWEYKMVWDKEVREITDMDLIEISVVSTPANASTLFTLSKSIKSFFEEIQENNLIDNNNIMEKEIIEQEVKEEVIEEIKEVEEEIIEWTNTISPDEVESVDEISTTETEAETETTENVEEVTEEVTEDEAGKVEELEKSLEVMKQELAEQKELVNSLLDNLIQLANKTQEVKSVVDNMPIKRWLATIGWEQKQIDPLVKALQEARNKV